MNICNILDDEGDGFLIHGSSDESSDDETIVLIIRYYIDAQEDTSEEETSEEETSEEEFNDWDDLSFSSESVSIQGNLRYIDFIKKKIKDYLF